MIILDEAIFAGFNTYYSNKNDYNDLTNYLYTNSYYWTLSPVSLYSDGNALIGSIDKLGLVNRGLVNVALGVRPVISLKSGTVVEPTGEGTTTKPYVVR